MDLMEKVAWAGDKLAQENSEFVSTLIQADKELFST
jgi:hypothetical protein